jgi:hypothetical protein
MDRCVHYQLTVSKSRTRPSARLRDRNPAGHRGDFRSIQATADSIPLINFVFVLIKVNAPTRFPRLAPYVLPPGLLFRLCQKVLGDWSYANS